MSEKPMSEEELHSWQAEPEKQEEEPPRTPEDVIKERMHPVRHAAKEIGKDVDEKRKQKKYGVKPDGTIEPEPGGGSTIYRHVNKPKA